MVSTDGPSGTAEEEPLKKFAALTITALIVGVLLASAQDVSPYQRKVGFLIPSQCQPQEGAKKPEGPYDDWPAPHTTECALLEACIKSGYGLWAEDRFFRFDESGQEMALEYFRSTPRTSYHKVEILGNFGGAKVKVKKLRMVD
jgi:hypothetical protein